VSASVSDATSGPAQTEDSAAADTTTVGAKTATVTGTDLAGNQATSGCGYRVSYRFDEFAHPVDNPHANGKPVLNVVKGYRVCLIATADAVRASSDRARTSCLCTGCNGSGRVGLPLVVPSGRLMKVV
jgi:hypothetical protein